MINIIDFLALNALENKIIRWFYLTEEMTFRGEVFDLSKEIGFAMNPPSMRMMVYVDKKKELKIILRQGYEGEEQWEFKYDFHYPLSVELHKTIRSKGIKPLPANDETMAGLNEKAKPFAKKEW